MKCVKTHLYTFRRGRVQITSWSVPRIWRCTMRKFQTSCLKPHLTSPNQKRLELKETGNAGVYVKNLNLTSVSVQSARPTSIASYRSLHFCTAPCPADEDHSSSHIISLCFGAYFSLESMLALRHGWRHSIPSTALPWN
ncbi:hypothetical protein Mapa_007890 [Marchantia paleacea]|nr:hypothetical protein Mapa_007890 [Marchantia paleacea]